MEITISDYKIKTDGDDGTCFTLFQNRPRMTGKNIGADHFVIIGHFPNISQACDRLLEEKIADSDASDISALRYDIKKYHNEVLAAVKDIEY